MKSVLLKRIVIAVTIQLLLASGVLGQKYENGTRLLKGAEVLSATPLQLDYVLENLADTAKIDVNIHEGKTHLVLNDGSGKWREWWYYMGAWRLKQNVGSSGLENSIQTKDGDGFSGSLLGINEGFIYSLDEKSSDVGLNNKTATVRVTPQGQAVMEATGRGENENLTNNIFVTANDIEQNITWISQSPRNGARLRMDTTVLEHAQVSSVFDFWNFRSSLPDTTFYVKKRLKFDQPNTSVYIKDGDLRLTDQTGDYALSDLKNTSETDPTVATHVKNITSANITNWNTAYTNSHAHGNKTVLDGIASANVTDWNNAFSWGNHATQGYLKSESDPVWTAEKGEYYTKTNLQTSGQAQIHWNNISNKPTIGTGSVTSVGLSLPNIFTVTGSPVTASGTMSATLASQNRNTVLAAPATANGTPVFRALQEADLPNIAWTKITGKPTTISGYGITDAYTKVETRTLIGDTATVLRGLIKNTSIIESDPTVASHVKNITSANITNWNTAYANSHTHSNKTVLDGIAATNVTNWNNAYNWGNHAAQGYLKTETDPVWTAAQGNYYTKTNLQTSGQAQVHWDNISNKPSSSTETDPTVPSHVKSITNTNVANWNTAYTNSHIHSNKPVLDGIAAANVTNWNTAYGWGNHASQGYLKTESDPVWTATKGNYYSKTNHQTSGGSQVHWNNITNKVNAARGTTGLISLPTGSTTNRYLSENGSWTVPYTLPIASTSSLGGIRVGTGLSISGNGTLSATGLINYSLQEQYTGQNWIDGKKVYQITRTASDNTGYCCYGISLGIGNIDHIISIQGTLRNDVTGAFYPLNFVPQSYGSIPDVAMSGWVTATVSPYNTMVNIQNTTNPRQAWTVNVTVQYTCKDR